MSTAEGKGGGEGGGGAGAGGLAGLAGMWLCIIRGQPLCSESFLPAQRRPSPHTHVRALSLFSTLSLSSSLSPCSRAPSSAGPPPPPPPYAPRLPPPSSPTMKDGATACPCGKSSCGCKDVRWARAGHPRGGGRGAAVDGSSVAAPGSHAATAGCRRGGQGGGGGVVVATLPRGPAAACRRPPMAVGYAGGGGGVPPPARVAGGQPLTRCFPFCFCWRRRGDHHDCRACGCTLRVGGTPPAADVGRSRGWRGHG